MESIFLLSALSRNPCLQPGLCFSLLECRYHLPDVLLGCEMNRADGTVTAVLLQGDLEPLGDCSIRGLCGPGVSALMNVGVTTP